MKPLITAATIALATATPAVAEKAHNARIQDVFTEMRVSEPYTVKECVMVRSGGNAGEGALIGMIVGGLIGKGATGDDNGAAAGAIIGGIVGADRASQKPRKPSGLNEKCTNVTRYRDTVQTVYDYSLITFTADGREYTLTFIK